MIYYFYQVAQRGYGHPNHLICNRMILFYQSISYTSIPIRIQQRKYNRIKRLALKNSLLSHFENQFTEIKHFVCKATALSADDDMAQVRSTLVVEPRRNRTDTFTENASSQWKAQCSLKRTISKCQLVAPTCPLDDAHKRKLREFTTSSREPFRGLLQRRPLTESPCGRSLSGKRVIRSRFLKSNTELHGLVDPNAHVIRMGNAYKPEPYTGFDVKKMEISEPHFSKESTPFIWTATVTVFRHITAHLGKILSSYALPPNSTFEHLRQQIELSPSKLLAIHSDISSQLGFPYHIVGEIVSLFLDLFNEENFREANMMEWIHFLSSLQTESSECVLYDERSKIWKCFYLQSKTMYDALLAKFKAYLIDWWLASKKIAAPCEFGKKSACLFLCMQCHREHT